MAKNEIEIKRHKSSLECKDKKCNGEPKEKIKATTFCGDICKKCFAIYSYAVLDNSMEKAFKLQQVLEKQETKTLTKKEDKVKTKTKQKGDQLDFEM